MLLIRQGRGRQSILDWRRSRSHFIHNIALWFLFGMYAYKHALIRIVMVMRCSTYVHSLTKIQMSIYVTHFIFCFYECRYFRYPNYFTKKVLHILCQFPQGTAWKIKDKKLFKWEIRQNERKFWFWFKHNLRIHQELLNVEISFASNSFIIKDNIINVLYH